MLLCPCVRDPVVNYCYIHMFIIIIDFHLVIFHYGAIIVLGSKTSMITLHHRRAAAALLPPISAWLLWPVRCGSPLSIKEGRVQSVTNVDPSIAVCYRIPSFLDARSDWNYTLSSFWLCDHFLVLLNCYSSIILCWCKKFRSLFDKLLKSKYCFVCN